ncbi:MAG: MFS transporter [Fibrobacteria bacterium]|nr:MFS transporter [Fibrobacteria bacterium]
MRALLKRLFKIERGEGIRALLLFGYIFFVIAALLIIKPVSNALFIKHIGIEHLPMAFMLVAFCSGLFIHFYFKASARWELRKLISVSLSFFIFCLFGFWHLLQVDAHGTVLYYAFYIWVALFGVVAASQFWLLANTVLNAREAKRLFGFIGSGAVSGGIFGGYLATVFADVIGSHNLLLLAGLFLLVCMGFLLALWNSRPVEDIKRGTRKEKKQLKNTRSPHKLIFSSPHLLLITGIIAVSVVIATLADFQYRFLAAEAYNNEDALTAFFGFWQSSLSIVALFIQLFFTSRILNRAGTGVSLLILPVGLFAGVASICLFPVLWSAIVLKVCDGSFKQSVNKAGMELLFLPVPARLKKQVKGFIDVFVDSLATGFAGLLLYLLADLLGLSVVAIGCVMMVLLAAWIYMVIKVKTTYIQTFRQALEKRTLDLEDPAGNYESAELLSYLDQAIDSGNERQLLYVLDFLSDFTNPGLPERLKKIVNQFSGVAQIHVLTIAQNIKTNVLKENAEAFLLSGNAELVVESLNYLFILSGKKSDYLNDYLLKGNKQFYWAAMICAARHAESDASVRGLLLKQTWSGKENNDVDPASVLSKMDALDKKQLAKVIATAKLEHLYPCLELLIKDRAWEVAREAVIQAGYTRSPLFVSRLLDSLGNHKLNRQARKALVKLGSRIIQTIDKRIRDENELQRFKRRLIKVLGHVDSQKSVNILQRYLKLFRNINDVLYGEVVSSLVRLNSGEMKFVFDSKCIKGEVRALIKFWYDLNEVLLQLAKVSKAQSENESLPSRHLLIQALEEKQQLIFKRIFQLLGFYYQIEDIWNAYKGIKSGSKQLKASAIEFLDNLLDTKIRRRLLPLIEVSSRKSLHTFATRFYGKGTKQDLFMVLLQGNDDWLRSCCAYYLINKNEKKYFKEIELLESNPNRIVKETAMLCKGEY